MSRGAAVSGEENPKVVHLGKRTQTDARNDMEQVPALRRSIALLLALAEAEASFRNERDQNRIARLLANALARLLLANADGNPVPGQCIVADYQRGKLVIRAISSVHEINRRASLTTWLANELTRVVSGTRNPEKLCFSLDLSSAPERRYPFSQGLGFLIPSPSKFDDGQHFVFILTSKPMDENAEPVTRRLGEAAMHAISAGRNGPGNLVRLVNRRNLAIAAMALLALMLLPVPMTVLAPAEVVPSEPFVVAAPISGVIEKIHVRPDAQVVKGEPVFSYRKTELQGRLDIARQNAAVAAARLRRAQQDSLGSGAGTRDLAIAASEYQLALAEQQQAARQLALADVTAPASGIAILPDPQQLSGKPVQTGERIMRIADPKRIEIRIDLAVSDSIVLGDGKSGRLFLDAEPLNIHHLTVVDRSYQAMRAATGKMVYRLTALVDDAGFTSRIGMRGTAQIHGNTTVLGLFLFRRPISAIRQRIGW
ncbi:MAG: hypothetical protein R3D32_06955 [Nitratireductor sp.]